MKPADDRALLEHILQSIQKILDYTQDGKKFFLHDPKTQDSVIRNFEVLGEAAKNISEKLKKQTPHIPWKAMGGMRDKMIHEYFGVDLDLVWETVEKQIPVLRKNLMKL